MLYLKILDCKPVKYFTLKVLIYVIHINLKNPVKSCNDMALNKQQITAQEDHDGLHLVRVRRNISRLAFHARSCVILCHAYKYWENASCHYKDTRCCVRHGASR